MDIKRETNRLVDNMFQNLRAKGVRALAKSNEEPVRSELLALMEALNVYEIEIHKAIQSEGIDKVLLKEGEELTEEMIAKLSAESEIIHYRK